MSIDTYGSEDAEDIYQDTYPEIRQTMMAVMPDLGAQLRDEVGRGRRVGQSELAEDDRESRQSRLRQSRMQKLGSTDVAMVPYSGRERVQLALEVILTQARTMHGARQAILDLMDDHGIASRTLVFGEYGDTPSEACHDRGQTLCSLPRAQRWARVPGAG
jgi:hypothetical protein